MAQNNDDLISDLDKVLDKHDEEEVSYIGKTFLYRCVDCGTEKYVKGDELEDVVCEECGGDMQIADEGIYDEVQAVEEEIEGKPELEVLQDQIEEEEIVDLPVTDENTGNITDASETDEALEAIDLELDDLDLVSEDAETDVIIPEDDEVEIDDDDEELSEYEELIPDFDDDDDSY